MLLHALFGSHRTQSYTVHESPTPPVDRIDRAEALRFIKDGFDVQAFAFAPVWLAAHKLWSGVVGYIAVAALVVAANEWLGLPDSAAVILLLALHLVVGFEGDALARIDLDGKGWQTLGSVTGMSRLDCERRFFDTWLPAQPIFTPRTGTLAAPPPQTAPPVAPTRSAAPPVADRSVAGRLAALWQRPTKTSQ